MLGSPCSPCCNPCNRYVPRSELSASVIAPYFTSGWRESVGLRQCAFTVQSPILQSPFGPTGGGFTVSLIGFNGTSYFYQYVSDSVYALSLVGCDQSAYQAWVFRNNGTNLTNPRYRPDFVTEVSRRYVVRVSLYPLPASQIDFFGSEDIFCGLVDFEYVETSVVRWSHGINSTHTLYMRPTGAPGDGSNAATTTLSPVWLGGGNPSNTANDGFDRTQYLPYQFLGGAGPQSEIFVSGSFSPAQYQESGLGAQSGGTFSISG